MKSARRLPFLLVLAACLPIFAQSSSPPKLPKNPSAMMLLAWQQNGLHDASLKPWHIHATWQTVDDKGQTTAQGTWEEWWAGSDRYRIAAASEGQRQAVYVTRSGEFLDGKAGIPEALVTGVLMTPVPDWEPLTSVRMQKIEHEDRGNKLTCAVREPSTAPEVIDLDKRLPQFCFADNIPAIRLVATINSQTIFNSIFRFQGRYVGRSIRVIRDGHPTLNIQVDTIELLNAGSHVDFDPPSSATPMPGSTGKIAVAFDEIVEDRIGGDAPTYPLFAKRYGISGTVVLEVDIGKDGKIDNIRTVSGPSQLQKAAIEAVRTWRFAPYLLNGVPAEVMTQVNVKFQFSNR